MLIAGTVFALAAGCSTSKQAQSSEVHAPVQEQNYNSTAYHGALAPDDGQWTRPAKDLASTRYTTLNQVTPENAQNLKVAFTFSLGTTRGAEAAPIVVNNTMYIVTPWPNYVYALDLTKPGGPLKWKFDPETSPASKGTACCDWVNRGGVYTDGEFIFNTLDGNTIALNADTGKPIWRNHVADIQTGETLTMAPLVVKDKVMVGNSGGEFGIRGWVKALDTKTGKLDWTAYTTGPDKDVLIGPRFHAFYQKDQGADLGVKTWPPDAWRHSGGGMWGRLPRLDGHRLLQRFARSAQLPFFRVQSSELREDFPVAGRDVCGLLQQGQSLVEVIAIDEQFRNVEQRLFARTLLGGRCRTLNKFFGTQWRLGSLNRTRLLGSVLLTFLNSGSQQTLPAWMRLSCQHS